MKKIISLILALLMFVSVVPMWASASAGVQSKIDEILSVFPAGSYFTVDSKSCSHSTWGTCNNCKLSEVLKSRGINYDDKIYPDGWTCYAFASYCFGYIFGQSFMNAVGVGSSGRVLDNQGLYNMFKSAKIGDFVYCWKPGKETDSPAHYAIFVSCDDNGVTLLHNNIGGSTTSVGKIACGYITYENLRIGGYGYDRVDIYRASNYDEIDSTDDLIQNGDIIKFGSYPQTEVKDEATINALNSLAPTWDKWTSYGYYSGDGNIGSMKQGDWMRYVDVPYDGATYRGVKFTQYRPLYTWENSSNSNTQQIINGYETTKVYWFKFEPIKWRVLDSESKLILSEIVLDSQPFNNTMYSDGNKSPEYYIDSEKTIKANRYDQSSVRTWLNNSFCNTAFDNQEKAKMQTFGTTVDRVVLLSTDEVINSNFGFNSSSTIYDQARFAKGSDYSKSQGLCYLNSPGSFNHENVHWLLRSPGNNSNSCRYVDINGCSKPNNNYYVSITSDGIRPAIMLKTFDVNTPCKHPNATTVPQLDPNCIDIGFTAGTYCNDCATWLSGHEVIAVGDHKDSNGDRICDTCLVELSKPGGTEVVKKNFIQKAIDAVKNAINGVVNFFRRLLGI
jgi:hypothetical protein